MSFETILNMSSADIKYGFGATLEVGFDMKALGARRVMVVTDPKLAQEEPVAVVLDALRKEGLDAVLYDKVRIEPTDGSLKEAVQFSVDGKFDGFVGVGGQGHRDRQPQHRSGRGRSQ